MDRKPVVAGQFYAGSAQALARDVIAYMDGAGPVRERKTLLAMVPHAGHVYSGQVAGRTLAEAALGETVILLGPNHTGRGAPVAVWPDGRWLFPGGALQVDVDLARKVVHSCPAAEADTVAHVYEHSLEVNLPFLAAKNPHLRIVPVAVARPDPATLLELGQGLAEVIRSGKKNVTIVVSSDMNHFLDDTETRRRDRLALDRIEALDPEGLFRTVRDESISMCGVLPMTVGLTAARELGATRAEVVRYATSGDASGDYSQVVGYAGVIVD